MINPYLPKSIYQSILEPYKLCESYERNVAENNKSFDTGIEYRLQPVYTKELWLKLKRAGYSPKEFKNLDILETCAGTGFLTYHLLKKCSPKSMTINEISIAEINSSKHLIKSSNLEKNVNWVQGDMNSINFSKKFDLILGNSFLHHFYDVPKTLKIFSSLLKNKGTFISLHEPTPIANILESGKTLLYPLAVLFPNFMNELIRIKKKPNSLGADIWLFEIKKLKKVILDSGFSKVRFFSWHLLRPLVVQNNSLHLNTIKKHLTINEEKKLERAFNIDSKLNFILPSSFFGSICIVCEK